MNHINLDDMRLFVAVVQAGSLSHASELTQIPISRLSRRLTKLESDLGTQLLNRGKKGVSLNELGERFFEQAQQMLQQAELAIEAVKKGQEKPSGLLKISVPSDIFQLMIAPNLPDYLAENPDVRLEISLSHQKINMIQDGIDLAIRVGTIDNENVVAKPLFEIDFGVFVPKNWAEISHPNELYQQPTIAQKYVLPWHFSLENHNFTVLPSNKILCNDFQLVKRLIEQGVGVGILPIYCVEPSEAQKLVRVLPEWQLQTQSVSVIYYKNRGAVATVKSFVAWLQALTMKKSLPK